MTTAAEPRRLRLCDVCGGLDDHPRHVTGLPGGATGGAPDQAFLDALPDGCPAYAIAELLDPTTYVRHMDCCAAQGCSICKETEAVHGGLRGDALLENILGGAVDHLSDSGPHVAAATEKAEED